MEAERRPTRARRVARHAHYMAPEQAEGQAEQYVLRCRRCSTHHLFKAIPSIRECQGHRRSCVARVLLAWFWSGDGRPMPRCLDPWTPPPRKAQVLDWSAWGSLPAPVTATPRARQSGCWGGVEELDIVPVAVGEGYAAGGWLRRRPRCRRPKGSRALSQPPRRRRRRRRRSSSRSRRRRRGRRGVDGPELPASSARSRKARFAGVSARRLVPRPTRGSSRSPSVKVVALAPGAVPARGPAQAPLSGCCGSRRAPPHSPGLLEPFFSSRPA